MQAVGRSPIAQANEQLDHDFPNDDLEGGARRWSWRTNPAHPECDHPDEIRHSVLISANCAVNVGQRHITSANDATYEYTVDIRIHTCEREGSGARG